MRIFPVAIGFLIGVGGLRAGDDGYSLELRPSTQSVQVGENVQIGLTIKGAKILDLGKDALPGTPKPLEWTLDPEFHTSIGYEPKTAGIKKVGPFELEFQGHHLKSNVVSIEVREAWALTDERYEFRVFPRKVEVGKPIRIYFVQQYAKAKGPFFNSTWNAPRNPDPKRWSARGGSGWKVGDNLYSKEECWFDLPTTKVGKMTLTKADLPDLPEEITVDPIEVDVVAAKPKSAEE